MAGFYHIYIRPRKGVTAATVQKQMDLAIDWFRYDDQNWIVYTPSDANKWHSRLRLLVRPNGLLFICRLDTSDRQGWMTKDFWEWMRKTRGRA